MLWISLAAIAALIVVVVLGYVRVQQQNVIAEANIHLGNAKADVGQGEYVAAAQQFQDAASLGPKYAFAQRDASTAMRCSSLFRAKAAIAALNLSFDRDIAQWWNDYNAEVKLANRAWQSYPGDTTDANAAKQPLDSLSSDTTNLVTDFDQLEGLYGGMQANVAGAPILGNVIGPFRELTIDANQMANVDMTDEQSDLVNTSYSETEISGYISDTNRLMPKVEADQTTIDGLLTQAQSADNQALQGLVASLRYE